jgi:hypothetical protein
LLSRTIAWIFLRRSKKASVGKLQFTWETVNQFVFPDGPSMRFWGGCANRAVRTSSPQRGGGSVIRPSNGEGGEWFVCLSQSKLE